MSEKFIITYIDPTGGKNIELNKTWHWSKSVDGEQQTVKSQIHAWRKENGFQIKRVQRYSSSEDATFDTELGGE